MKSGFLCLSWKESGIRKKMKMQRIRGDLMIIATTVAHLLSSIEEEKVSYETILLGNP
jgi:hypothetical protein